jgi:integrating conjugative element protein (TIGR03765 family)
VNFNWTLAWCSVATFLTVGISASAQSSLTVVQDVGGVSALHYYRRLHLIPTPNEPTPHLPTPVTPQTPDLLPVHSSLLSPGHVDPQVIRAPGLSPLFLIGDDDRSRVWLRDHLLTLRQIYATGFVVNVDTAAALASLRSLAPGLTLVAASGDDLAGRLGLTHYPVLLTATGLEQ